MSHPLTLLEWQSWSIRFERRHEAARVHKLVTPVTE
jgi:hypothetical protein